MAATKLRPPAFPTRLVHRPHLDEMFDGGIDAQGPLVLVSAPAGSGKSTLLASWASRRVESVAWLQVEEVVSTRVVFMLVVLLPARHVGVAGSWRDRGGIGVARTPLITIHSVA